MPTKSTRHPTTTRSLSRMAKSVFDMTQTETFKDMALAVGALWRMVESEWPAPVPQAVDIWGDATDAEVLALQRIAALMPALE